jgi:hypothetical protein
VIISVDADAEAEQQDESHDERDEQPGRWAAPLAQHRRQHKKEVSVCGCVREVA